MKVLSSSLVMPGYGTAEIGAIEAQFYILSVVSPSGPHPPSAGSQGPPCSTRVQSEADSGARRSTTRSNVTLR